MQKHSKSIKIFYLAFLLLSLTACKYVDEQKKEKGFVYIEENSFKIDGEDFFPLMLNYVIEFREIEDEVFISASKNYELPYEFEYDTKEGSLNQLDVHFGLIKELGFNTIRVCMDRVELDENGKHYYSTENRNLYINENFKKFIDALEELVEIAENNNLKMMLLIKPPIANKELENFTVNILKRFYQNTTIFAYDFMNEPLYLDSEPVRKKKDALKIVQKWSKLMKRHAPYQLFTIGFAEPIEVFQWDPYLLPVDFVQFHTYHPLRVPNEIYWYSKYIGKPWMVGETALPADNDSISYEMQVQFMKDAYRHTIDCGGAGFGWWEFQEWKHTHFEAEFTGLLTHEGKTITPKGEILGTLKPAALEVANLKKYKKQEPQQAVNYYNMMGYNNVCINGKIINKSNNKPIEGAVIRGWNEYWSVGMNTFSDENGEFTLYSNDECVHFEISAPGMSKVKFDATIEYQNIGNNTISFDSLPDRYLEYHQISFLPFLKDTVLENSTSNYPIFDFDKEMFFNAKFQGKMEDIYLKPIR